jgi:hypothetical protein
MSDQPTLATLKTTSPVGPTHPDPANIPAAPTVGDLEVPVRLRSFVNSVVANPDQPFTPDADFIPVLQRAVNMLEKRGLTAPWRRSYSGSGENKGWSVYAGNDLIAYLGGDDTFGQAVDAMVLAHNKALGYVE